MSYTYKYSRCLHSVDCVVMGWIGDQLKILLITEKDKDNWRCPGKILKIKEEPVDNVNESDEIGQTNTFVEGRQWGFKNEGVISNEEKKCYYPQIRGYENGLMLRQCVRDALRFSSTELEFSLNSDTFIQLPVRDCPYRDSDRSLLEPNNKKYWWVISTPYLIFANPCWTGSRERQLSKSELDAIFSDDDIMLKDVRGNDVIARWVPMYQILYDNDIVIREREEPRTFDAFKEEKAETKQLRPSEEIIKNEKKYKLLFDHAFIIEDALLELRRMGRRQPLGATFFRTITESRGFDVQFSLKQLNRLYELVFDKPMSLPNLKKTLLDRHLITKVINEAGDVAKSSEGTRTRHVELYRFDTEWYDYYTENQNLGLKI